MFCIVPNLFGRSKSHDKAQFKKKPIQIQFNPFPNDKFNSSKPKEFADDNFKFDENGRKFQKRGENIVGKGEIARYDQFLLFPGCFQKT